MDSLYANLISFCILRTYFDEENCVQILTDLYVFIPSSESKIMASGMPSVCLTRARTVVRISIQNRYLGVGQYRSV
jgi:hypothetical protein